MTQEIIQSALIEAKVCLRHAKYEGGIQSEQVREELEKLTNRILVGVKTNPYGWQQAWDFIFEHSSSENKAKFLNYASKVMDEKDKKMIDKQILNEGSFNDSIYFCAKCDWAKVARHQDKVLAQTTSPLMCEKFYTFVPTASYYKTQKRLIEMKNTQKRANADSDVLGVIDQTMASIEATMEHSKVRRTRAARELENEFRNL